jgi:hypothetical protein
MLIAQSVFNVVYYTVLPQIKYQIPESIALIKTTVCMAGTEPGFGQEINTPGFNGVAGSRSFQVKSFPPPEGYAFYKMTIQLEKAKEEVKFDINKTWLITNNGYKAYPYYALPLIIGAASEEKDLLKQESTDSPFIVTFPKGRTQKYVDIWYAIPISDSPVTYEFYGSQCEVEKYEKKK